MNADNLITAIKKVHPGVYGLKWGEMETIFKVSDNKLTGVCVNAFYWGFLKGQQAAMKVHQESEEPRA